MKFLNRTNNKKPIISLKNIVKTFPVGDDNITVLHDISLDIHPGEFVSIVGPPPTSSTPSS